MIKCLASFCWLFSFTVFASQILLEVTQKRNRDKKFFEFIHSSRLPKDHWLSVELTRVLRKKSFSQICVLWWEKVCTKLVLTLASLSTSDKPATRWSRNTIRDHEKSSFLQAHEATAYHHTQLWTQNRLTSFGTCCVAWRWDSSTVLCVPTIEVRWETWTKRSKRRGEVQ